ncbi:hypothetical protein EEAAV_26195 (plasmid) [Rahnella aceris]
MKLFCICVALIPGMLLTGCGYHFSSDVESYDLLERPVVGKSVQVVPPDHSLPSRVYSEHIENIMERNGLKVAHNQSDYHLFFSVKDVDVVSHYWAEPVTGTVDYALDKEDIKKKGKAEYERNLKYKPIEGTVGYASYKQSYFVRELKVTIQDMRQVPPKSVLEATAVSETNVISDEQTYKAMIDTLLNDMGTKVLSGRHSTVIPYGQ